MIMIIAKYIIINEIHDYDQFIFHEGTSKQAIEKQFPILKGEIPLDLMKNEV